ncbi:hypothetical protein A3H03_00275 [Candidatus Kuenenbacteria bacterium RIFCSPLOWO2_12_FULL_42_13]|uniref:Uncharacterized protein n=3 Tax=Candidatus Kueneniibacteriota TaxID=1752740 RepID=A0A1F6FZY3_9BACT|nr:MAG: hypothetical protein A3H55_03155 [Candidatus Kuenenbacteria bacterium RIFCSPLOWO2_02_FULL_42_16]OGG91410.1 MAG: hypothetical protein A3H03_00275 [Candidatus Kuenenbacteria bacterium RIFCSPLOWO2_12_FULL_42_13]OGH00584.1 MAG: hypothetical protein A3E04_02735 [Candidatus Kuenenbacteria bacterium RIFCSPHIGHO2_12_FULL_42_14]
MILDKQNLWRRISKSEIRNSAAEKSESESEGGQKFPACRLPALPTGRQAAGRSCQRSWRTAN